MRKVYLTLSILLFVLYTYCPAVAQSPNRVGLVVRFGDGSVTTKCVEFNEGEISGYDVLQRAGLSVIADVNSNIGLGAGICKIGNDGCNFPAERCFCQCPGGVQCVYWSYWHLSGDTWQYSQLGASSYRVHNGDVEGWNWGSGTTTSAEEPPVHRFEEICPLPTDTPAPPTNTPVPPTATPVPPTATPIPPTATFVPTATPIPAPTDTPIIPTPQIEFSADYYDIIRGACIKLRIDVDGVDAVYLDGEGVGGHDTKEVCPKQNRTYTLKVESAAGEFTREVKINVIEPTATPMPQETTAPQSASTSPPEPQPTSPPAAEAQSAPSDTPIPQDTAATDTPAPENTPAEVQETQPSDTPVVIEGIAPTNTSAPTETPTTAPTATATATPVAIAVVPAASPLPTKIQVAASTAPAAASSPNRMILLIGGAGLMILGWAAFGVALIAVGIYYYRWRQRESYYSPYEHGRGYR